MARDDHSGGLTALRQRVVAGLRARGTYRRWVLVTALVGMFATTFPVTILAVALPQIADEFGESDATLTWVISAPMLASAVALPVLGKMGDLRGQRKVFLAGFIAATAVAGVTAFAWSALALIALRTLTQVIGSATQPTSMALIMRAFPAEERVKAMGWWSLVGAGAPAIGLAVGGPLVDAVGWRVVFAIQAGLAVIPVIAAALVLEETPPAHRGARFDVGGAASIGFAAGGLMFALNQSADWGWAHPAVVGERRGALLGTTLLAGAMAIFATGAFSRTVPLIGLALLVQGVGNGIARPPLGAVLANSVDEADLGIASATQRMVRLVGNASGIAVLTAVYGGTQTAESFGAAYLVALGLGILAVGATARIDGAEAKAAAITPRPSSAAASGAAPTT